MLKFNVLEEDGSRLGVVFLDLLAREGKFQGSAHFIARCGRRVHDFEITDPTPDDTTVLHIDRNTGKPQLYQLPIVMLTTSFPGPPDGNTSDCFIAPGQAETLFHEFGHALHSMLSRTEFQHLSGRHHCVHSVYC